MANYPNGLNLLCVPLHKKYRSHIELIALILEAVKNNNSTRYPLMKYTSNNYAQLKKYLELLTNIGFISAETKEGKISYRTNEKGTAFLRQYNILRDMLISACSRGRLVNNFYEECDTSNVQQFAPTPLVTRFVKRL